MSRGTLRIERFSVGYASGTRATVSGVSIEIRPGEIYGLIGPNASGKTTLVRGVAGRAKIFSGSAAFDGRNLTQLRAKERAKVMSIVPQVSGLPEGYTVYEVVAMGRSAYHGAFGWLNAEDREKIEAALEMTGLIELRDQPSHRLSGGEQQRVLLARAFAQDTPVMILDEPTAFLDLYYQIRLLDLVRDYSMTKRRAVLLILHDLNLAARYTDRVMILSQGRPAASGETRRVLDADQLSAIYRLPIERIERGNGSPLVLIPK